MFTIIIPLYNKEKQISKTLESVLNQTYQDYEIIIINDGSKDNSEQVVKSFSDDRIRLINQKNAGVSAARNKGIKEAKNDWIAFLDADDLWKPNKLEIVSNKILLNKDINWIATGVETIKGNDIKTFVYSKDGFLEDVLDDLCKGLFIQTSGVIVKKEIFKNHSNFYFREGANHSEDRELWIKLAFTYPSLFYIKDILSSYIRDTTSQSLTTSSVNYDFLKMKDWLHHETLYLDKNRQNKFLYLDSLTNRRNLLYIWVNTGKYDYLSKYFTKNEIYSLKITSNFPRIIKLIILKLILKK